MVRQQLIARGIEDAAVIAAMRSVPREAFLAPGLAPYSYADTPLPIGAGQTISQPFIVALMAEKAQLTPGDKLLEIGTGSGYAAAVYAMLVAHVFTMERHDGLAKGARRALYAAGFGQVRVRAGDGTLGWPEQAPFDAIIVAAGTPAPPPSLRAQLAIGGRMVLPVGKHGYQHLVRLTRLGRDAFKHEQLGPVRFVPLVGREGWAGEESADPVSLGADAAGPTDI